MKENTMNKRDLSILAKKADAIEVYKADGDSLEYIDGCFTHIVGDLYINRYGGRNVLFAAVFNQFAHKIFLSKYHFNLDGFYSKDTKVLVIIIKD